MARRRLNQDEILEIIAVGAAKRKKGKKKKIAVIPRIRGQG